MSNHEFHRWAVWAMFKADGMHPATLTQVHQQVFSAGLVSVMPLAALNPLLLRHLEPHPDESPDAAEAALAQVVPS